MGAPLLALAGLVACTRDLPLTAPAGGGRIESAHDTLWVQVGDTVRLGIRAWASDGRPLTAADWEVLQTGGRALGVIGDSAVVAASPATWQAVVRLRADQSVQVPVTVVADTVAWRNVDILAGCADGVRVPLVTAATGVRVRILRDPRNPVNAWTPATYDSLARLVDTLVAPVIDATWGHGVDWNGTGRVEIVYTMAINALSAPGSTSYVGGTVSARDLLPRHARGRLPGCPGSNEAEIFYMLTPDPQGLAGPVIAEALVRANTVATIGHEWQHQVNEVRRLYRVGGEPFEMPWLNEGLSHITEELIFDRATHLASRQRLGFSTVAAFGPADTLQRPFWNYMRQNSLRLATFLQSPGVASPVTAEPTLAQRGAIWSFLRYAVDRAARDRHVDEVVLWQGLLNSPVNGTSNLTRVFGDGWVAWMDDWAVSLYASLSGVTLPAPWDAASWEWGSLVTAVSPTAPPVVPTIDDDHPGDGTVVPGGILWRRASLHAGVPLAVRVTDTDGAPLSPCTKGDSLLAPPIHLPSVQFLDPETVRTGVCLPPAGVARSVGIVVVAGTLDAFPTTLFIRTRGASTMPAISPAPAPSLVLFDDGVLEARLRAQERAILGGLSLSAPGSRAARLSSIGAPATWHLALVWSATP